MNAVKNLIFYKEATTVELPLIDCNNSVADIIAVEIEGDYTSGEFYFEGKTDITNENWSPIFAIDMARIEAVTKATANGIYYVEISGLQKFRVRIDSISGGSATVFGRVVQEV